MLSADWISKVYKYNIITTFCWWRLTCLLQNAHKYGTTFGCFELWPSDNSKFSENSEISPESFRSSVKCYYLIQRNDSFMIHSCRWCILDKICDSATHFPLSPKTGLLPFNEDFPLNENDSDRINFEIQNLNSFKTLKIEVTKKT